ncbi:hypothetical protein R5R35_010827 [Gryllus longicercus]|uniref:Phosphatidylinositol-specific phospholipase C X domain-containing protein n=1 Tax=Gryllus longicercus TaxID=2509291 RepID=A0AAN9ZCC5_9ORTH
MSWVAISLVLAASLSGAARGATPWVSVTVSPLLTTTPKRQLVVSWAHAQPQAGDWVGLFASDPSNAAGGRSLSGLALARVEVAPGEAEGRALSGVEAARDAEEVTQCAAYVRAADAHPRGEERVLAVACARMYPDWMGDLAASIGGLRLKEVLLPGTHDSGAYRRYSPLVPQTIVEKYSITQEEDIGTQLRLGVRYLDIRVGHYPSTSARWWVNHGVVRLHPLQDVVDDVKDFIRNHPNEVVIFDVQEFPVGFGEDLSVHRALVAFLSEELAELAAPKALGWDATLARVWAQRGRVVLAYDRADVIASLPTAPLWPAVRQLWGDVRTLDALRDYLHRVIGSGASSQPSAHAAMAELTPNAWDVVLDQLGGLRKMADAVNAEMTELLRDEWAANTNAFAVDFVRGTDVVRVAVDFNRHRGERARAGRSRA